MTLPHRLLRSLVPILLVVAASAAASAQPALVPSWSFGATGQGIGARGMAVGNTPSGPEVYATSSESAIAYVWYALRYRPDTRRFERTFMSERFERTIVGIGVADVLGDARGEIVVALQDGRVVVYDQLTRGKVGGFHPPSPGVEAMAVRDGEGDGKAEILLASAAALRVYAGDGTLLWQLGGVGGGRIALGQMDDDAGLEIALPGVSSSSPGTVVDWASHAVQWDQGQDFASWIDAADIDGDGRDELIATEYWGGLVRAFDVETHLPKWSIAPPSTAGDIRVANLDCDGVPDLLIGSRNAWDLYAYDTATRSLKWTVDLDASGVTGLMFADVTGDGWPEVVFAEGFNDSGGDHLMMVDPATQQVVTSTLHFDGPILGPVWGDLDGDGAPEILAASTSTDNRYAGGRLVAFDGRTLRTRNVSDPLGGTHPGYALVDLKLRNTDPDPALEVVVPIENYPFSWIEIRKLGADGQFTRTWESPATPSVHGVEVADIDGDGNLEVIGATGWDKGVKAFDLGTQAVEWDSGTLTPGFRASRVSVLTAGGGAPHVVLLLEEGSIHIFDGVTKQPLPPLAGVFMSLVPDETGGLRAFWAGDDAGNVYRYERQGNAYGLTATYDVGEGQVDGVARLAGTQFAVGADGVLSVYASPGGALLWRSEDYGEGFGGWIALGSGAQRRVFAGGGLGVVALAPAVSLSSVAPRTGPAGGGTRLTVTGASNPSFAPGAALFIGGLPATGVQVTPAEIQGDVPALAAGALHDVVVSNPDLSMGVLAASFMTDFNDVDSAHLFHDFVARLVANLVSGGCGGGSYCAIAPVTRAQMAVFLLRSRFGPAFVPAPPTGGRFGDVGCGTFAGAYIEELARRGIAGGCGGGDYCPASPVTRAQMAVFLLTTLEGGSYVPPPATGGVFTDVPAGDPFARWIEELARRGITGGCGGGNYCPDNPVSRGEMAVFLSTTFALP
jgi:hypothetical protein